MVGIVWPSWVGVDVMGWVCSLVGTGLGLFFGWLGGFEKILLCNIYNECVKAVCHNKYNHTF